MSKLNTCLSPCFPAVLNCYLYYKKNETSAEVSISFMVITFGLVPFSATPFQRF